MKIVSNKKVNAEVLVDFYKSVLRITLSINNHFY